MINLGFIGAGDISILHAEAIERIEGASLKALWNITPDLAAEKSARFNCQNVPTVEALLNDKGVDAIFVLTSLEAHHKYVKLALEAGKHVFVEKPVAASVAEIRDMQELAASKNLICMPGHNYIYEPHVTRTKKFISEGKLGHLVSIYILYNIHHPEEVAARCEGVIRQILTHHAYITLFLGGLPTEVSAMKTTLHYDSLTLEDLAMVNIKLSNGALVHYCASFAADDHSSDPWTMVIKVIGTKGATRFSYRDWVDNTPAEVHSQTYLAYPESIYNIDKYFIEECILAGKKPHSTLQDAIDAQRLIEAIEQSVAESRNISFQAT